MTAARQPVSFFLVHLDGGCFVPPASLSPPPLSLPPYTPRGLRLPPGTQQTCLLCTQAVAALCLPRALPSRTTTSSSANAFSSRHSEPSWSLQVAPSPFPWTFYLPTLVATLCGQRTPLLTASAQSVPPASHPAGVRSVLLNHMWLLPSPAHTRVLFPAATPITRSYTCHCSNVC